jgi:ketosteroid isomerase-like protein
MTQATAVDGATVEALRRHWDQGWNLGDVDEIMAPFAADVVFTSPFVSRLNGDSRPSIEGYDALRAYVAAALERTPGIRYTVDATHVGTDSIVLVYTVHRPDGTDKPGTDWMRVRDGKVVEWRCHYSVDFIRAV